MVTLGLASILLLALGAPLAVGAAPGDASDLLSTMLK